MKAKVSVKMNKSSVKAVKEAQYKALKSTAVKILGEKVDSGDMPFGEGTLQNVLTDVDTGSLKKGKIVITSRGPYAKRLYYNPQYNFNKEFNANAGGEWWEDWITGKNANKPQKIFSYFYKKSSGGTVK